MYIRLCESPLRIKKEHRFMYVPCGKCPTCVNRRSSQMVDRLLQESQCHPYTLFFTLTYDERHVPKLYYDASNKSLYDPEREIYVDTSEIKGFKPSSRLYLSRRKEIPYAYMKDLQDFFKRFRYYVERLLENESKENKKIRYYAVSEYGPSTYRPHYHGLVWFDSKEIALRVHELVRKSWSFGRIDAQLAFGKSEQYVARYVNCVGSLPKVYLHRFLHPKSISSQSPAIGTLEANEKEVRQIFDRGLCERVLEFQRLGQVKTSPLWRTFESRLFPKIARFGTFNHHERVTLYSVYRQCPVEGFEGFVEWVKELNRKPYETWLSKELVGLLYMDSHEHTYVNQYSRLKKLYYASSRVYHQRKVFGVSLDYYVGRIENYYQKKERLKLKKFYEFQVDWSKKHGNAKALLFMSYGLDEINLIPKHYFRSYGFDTSSFLSLSSDISEAKIDEMLDSSRFIAKNGEIYYNNSKTKKQNDYLQNCKDKFNFNLERNYE